MSKNNLPKPDNHVIVLGISGVQLLLSTGRRRVADRA